MPREGLEVICILKRLVSVHCGITIKATGSA